MTIPAIPAHEQSIVDLIRDLRQHRTFDRHPSGHYWKIVIALRWVLRRGSVSGPEIVDSIADAQAGYIAQHAIDALIVNGYIAAGPNGTPRLWRDADLKLVITPRGRSLIEKIDREERQARAA